MSQDYIYFVQEEENNNIKIGVSVNPVQRLQEFNFFKGEQNGQF